MCVWSLLSGLEVGIREVGEKGRFLNTIMEESFAAFKHLRRFGIGKVGLGIELMVERDILLGFLHWTIWLGWRGQTGRSFCTHLS
jgi:hypothetical protein